MRYHVTLSGHAARDLDRFQGRVYLRLQSAIGALADNPRPRGCLKLTASGEWRVRVGAYRIRYLIDDAAHAITVTRIGHRCDVYDY